MYWNGFNLIIIFIKKKISTELRERTTFKYRFVIIYCCLEIYARHSKHKKEEDETESETEEEKINK